MVGSVNICSQIPYIDNISKSVYRQEDFGLL